MPLSTKDLVSFTVENIFEEEMVWAGFINWECFPQPVLIFGCEGK